MTIEEEILLKLEEIKKKIDTKPKEFMSFNETSEYLKIAKSYLYKMTYENKIPHYKPNGKIYFEKTDLENWILSKKV